MLPSVNRASQLAQRLEDVLSDARLERVRGSGRICTVTMWLLELSLPEGTVHRLAYAQVLPSAERTPSWTAADGGRRQQLGGKDGVRYRMPRVNYTGDAPQVLAFFQALLHASTLAEAAEAAGLPALTEQMQPYATLRLPSVGDARTPAVAVRPPVLLEPPLRAASGWSSVLPSAPTVVAAVVLLDKALLWNDDAIAAGVRPILVCTLLEHLAQMTGLSFTGADASRLGNVEWMDALGTDDDGEPLINVEFNRETRRVEDDAVHPHGETSIRIVAVSVDARVAPVGTELMIRCRLSNGEALDDHLQTAIAMPLGTPLFFTAREEVSRVEITVWRRHGETFVLAAERRADVMRAVDLEMTMVSASGRLRSKWLEPFDRDKAVAARAARMASFQQRHPIRVSVGGHTLDPWRGTQRDTDALTQTLFPQDSGARYFPRTGEGEAPLLGFAEWLKEFTADGETGRLLIVDPYFGSFGVDLLARAVRTDVTYQVVTCTQLRADEEDEDSSDAATSSGSREPQVPRAGDAAEPQRASELRYALEALRPALSGLDLEICDLRKDGMGRSGSFHDRFVLVYGRDNELRAGFNLSNSLQGAV